MTNTLLQFRVDNKLKKDATKVYEDLWLDLPSAIKLFMKKTIKLQKLPFSINDENDELEQAIMQNKKNAIEELDAMNFKISKAIDEDDEIFNGIMEKYESIDWY